MSQRDKIQKWNPEKARALIHEQGRTREWIADQVGLSKGSLNQILNGRKPSIQTVKLLASVLGCRDVDLLRPKKAS